MAIPSTAFAVRFVYNAVTFDFDEPTQVTVTPPQVRAAANRVYSGKTEWLSAGLDARLTLMWFALSKTKLDGIYTWWSTWYSQGKQTAITLDRLNTATALWEYTQWNTYFTKAEPPDLTIPAFPYGRPALEGTQYTFGPISFRQGG